MQHLDVLDVALSVHSFAELLASARLASLQHLSVRVTDAAGEATSFASRFEELDGLSMLKRLRLDIARGADRVILPALLRSPLVGRLETLTDWTNTRLMGRTR